MPICALSVAKGMVKIMTKILAHRGASILAPENTMAAFRKAKMIGAYGVELDVHVLPDKTVVVHHDALLGRCEEVSGSIYDYRCKSIKSFSVGGKFSVDYKDEMIPYFEEVLAYIKQNHMLLNCEIKRDTCFAYTYEEEVIKQIESYGMMQNTIISSFDHRILKNIKKEYPEYRVGILYGETHGIDIIDYCIENAFDAIHPYYSIVDRNLVDRAHKSGITVNVWTVDAPEDIRRMKAYGVDTIITNDVETAIKCIYDV